MQCVLTDNFTLTPLNSYSLGSVRVKQVCEVDFPMALQVLPETQQLFKTAEVPLDKEICLILEMMNNSKTSQVSERLHQIASIRDTALQQSSCVAYFCPLLVVILTLMLLVDCRGRCVSAMLIYFISFHKSPFTFSVCVSVSIHFSPLK